MISTVNDLQKYITKEAQDFHDENIKRRFMMTSSGSSKDRIDTLKQALPGIPDSYTQWLEKINLNGISIGYFTTSPYSYYQNDIVDALIESNNDDMFEKYAKKYNLYLIAIIADYGVYVATSESLFKEGEIILIDENILGEDDNPEQWIYKLAKDFEQFLIVAGNLNQLHREIKEDDSNYEEKKSEFLDRLKKLGVSEEYHKAWLGLF